MTFKVYDIGNTAKESIRIKKDPTVVIWENKFVTLDGNGLAIEAVAASTELAFTEAWAWEGKDYVMIFDPSKTQEMVFVGESNVALTDQDKSGTFDLVVTSWEQQLDLWNSATDVLKLSATERNLETSTTVFVTINSSI